MQNQSRAIGNKHMSKSPARDDPRTVQNGLRQKKKYRTYFNSPLLRLSPHEQFTQSL
jgi:hypothetical protein